MNQKTWTGIGVLLYLVGAIGAGYEPTMIALDATGGRGPTLAPWVWPVGGLGLFVSAFVLLWERTSRDGQIVAFGLALAGGWLPWVLHQWEVLPTVSIILALLGIFGLGGFAAIMHQEED